LHSTLDILRNAVLTEQDVIMTMSLRLKALKADQVVFASPASADLQQTHWSSEA